MANSIPTGLVVIKAGLKLTLDKVWGDTTIKNPDWKNCGFKESNTSDAYVDDQEYGHTGIAPAVGEGDMIPIDGVVEGYPKRYWMVKYALRMVVTEEALDDGKYEDAIAVTKSINRSLILTQEYEGAGLFINAFSTSFVGGDGLSLCNAAHLIAKGGGTFSNQFSTAMSLSETAVETMCVNMAKIPGSNGYIQSGYNLRRLVIPYDLRFRAARILKSDQQNDTANNAINVLKGENIQYGTNRYLTSPTNWFGVSDLEQGIRFIWRKKPFMREHNTEDNYTMTQVGIERFGIGWSDPRDVYGSNI